MNYKCKNIDNQSYDSVDLFKLICSFLVVSVHVFSESFSWYYVNLFSRLGVYFFFVASVYFFFTGLDFENYKIKRNKENKNKLRRYMFRVTLLYLVWSIIYLFSMIPSWIFDKDFTVYKLLKYLLDWITYGSYYHLWFVLALVYVIPMIYIFLLRFTINKLILLASVLYLLGLMYGEFSFINPPLLNVWGIIGEIFPIVLIVVFRIFPLCSFSIMVFHFKISKHVSFISLIVSFFLYSVEGLFFHYILDTVTSYNVSYNVFMIPTVIFLFVFIKSITINLKYSFIFRKLSTIIYCLHPLVIVFLNLFPIFVYFNSLLYFAVVSIVTSLLSLAIVLLGKKVKWLKLLM